MCTMYYVLLHKHSTWCRKNRVLFTVCNRASTYKVVHFAIFERICLITHSVTFFCGNSLPNTTLVFRGKNMDLYLFEFSLFPKLDFLIKLRFRATENPRLEIWNNLCKRRIVPKQKLTIITSHVWIQIVQ